MNNISPNNNIAKSKEILMQNSLQEKSSSKAQSPIEKDKQELKAKLEKQPKQDMVMMEGNKKSKDPLLTYPGRGLAYTNEVGVALNPISKIAGTLLWIPALMYFGADIYDKYKRGEDGDYSKSSKRTGVQQAVFQGLASCLLPIFAVHGGQHVGSHMYKNSKNGRGLTADAQMEILTAMKNKVSEGKITATTTQAEAEKEILEPITNLFSKNIKGKSKKEQKSLLSFAKTIFKNTHKMDKETTEKFVKEEITAVLTERDRLLKDKPKNFTSALKKHTNELDNQTEALKDTLGKFINKKTLKPNTMKTIGGFAALFALAMPIDYIVENVIIKKAVEPGLKQVEKKANEDPTFLGGIFFKGNKEE